MGDRRGLYDAKSLGLEFENIYRQIRNARYGMSLKNAAIWKGGITVADQAFVGDVGGEFGLWFNYEGGLKNSATVAATHKSGIDNANAVNAAQQAELTSQAGSINYLAGIATAHSGLIASQGSRISTLEGDLSSLQSEVNGISGALGGVSGGIDGILSTIGNMQQAITNLQQRVRALEGGGGPIDPIGTT